MDWSHRAVLVTRLEDPRLRQLGQRLVYWHAPEHVSEHYAQAAHATIRDRWSSKDPDAPWMTAAGLESQLGEIADAGALDQPHANALREFYRFRLTNLSA